MAADPSGANRATEDLLLVLQSEAGIDPDYAEQLAVGLRSELIELDIESLENLPSSNRQRPGSKAGDFVAVSEWLITASASGGAFSSILATVQAWLGRQRADHSVKISIGKDTIELAKAEPDERKALIEAFVKRHSRSS